MASVDAVPLGFVVPPSLHSATRLSRLSGPARPLAATSDVRRPLTTPAAWTVPSGASAFASVASSSPELTATKKIASGSRPSARAAARCSLALPDRPARSASTASTRRAPRGRAASSCRAAIRHGGSDSIDEEAGDNSLFRAQRSQDQRQSGWQSSLDSETRPREGKHHPRATEILV